MARPGGLKVGPWPDLAQWARCHWFIVKASGLNVQRVVVVSFISL